VQALPQKSNRYIKKKKKKSKNHYRFQRLLRLEFHIYLPSQTPVTRQNDNQASSALALCVPQQEQTWLDFSPHLSPSPGTNKAIIFLKAITDILKSKHDNE
jgi:hypothetical protein